MLLAALWRDLLVSTLLCTAGALLCSCRGGSSASRYPLLCSGAVAAALYWHRDAALRAQPLLSVALSLLCALQHAPSRPRYTLLLLLLFANLAVRNALARAGLLLTLF